MSTPATPATLREMDLQLKGIGDETVKYSRWGRKIELHILAKKSYQSDKPEDDGDFNIFRPKPGSGNLLNSQQN